MLLPIMYTIVPAAERLHRIFEPVQQFAPNSRTSDGGGDDPYAGSIRRKSPLCSRSRK
jgi:hypothetical protein